MLLQADPMKQLQLRGHDDTLSAFDLSPCGSLLTTGQSGGNADVVVWDTATLAQRFRFEEHDAEVCALAFSHDSRLLATVGGERCVCLCSTVAGLTCAAGQHHACLNTPAAQPAPAIHTWLFCEGVSCT